MRNYLFVSHSSVLHGAEISLLELIKLLKEKEKCKIQVVIPFPIEDSDFFTELNNLEVDVILLNYKYTRWVDSDWRILVFLKQNLKLIFTFFKLLIKCRPDIIVFNTIVLTPIFALVSKFFNSKKIWLIHELGDEDHGYRFLLGKWFSIRLIYSLVDQVVYNSEFTRSKYGVLYRNESKTSVFYPVIINKSDASMDVNIVSKGDNILRILVLGRTCEGKGQMDTLIALNVLVKKYNIRNVQLCFVGKVKNEYTDKMVEFSVINDLEDYVLWVEFTDKSTVHNYLCDSDVAIVSSRNEAFGRITVEYLFYGLIVIGTNVGGTMEILRKFEDNTFNYSPGDTNELVKHLLTVYNLSNEEFKLKVDTIVQNSNAYFNVEKYLKGWNNILMKLSI